MFRLSALVGNCAERTSEFPRVPRKDFIDECPMVHFNTFIVAGVPLYIDLSEIRSIGDDLHLPVHPSL
jgi:hypothetical protein